jgi:hypothetical protein
MPWYRQHPYPPLPKTQGRGTHSFETGNGNQSLKGRATRPWDNDMEIMNRIDKCLSEEIEEINQIETEAANESFMDLPWLPGKSLAVQGAEAGAEQVGAEGMAHIIPYLDYVFLGWDMVDQAREYNKFKKKLKDAQQRGCKCIQDAANQ